MDGCNFREVICRMCVREESNTAGANAKWSADVRPFFLVLCKLCRKFAVGWALIFLITGHHRQGDEIKRKDYFECFFQRDKGTKISFPPELKRSRIASACLNKFNGLLKRGRRSPQPAFVCAGVIAVSSFFYFRNTFRVRSNLFHQN